jgi:hypothetical protein
MKRRDFLRRLTPLLVAPWTAGCGGGADTVAEVPPPPASHLGRITDAIAKKGAKSPLRRQRGNGPDRNAKAIADYFHLTYSKRNRQEFS